MPKGTHKNAITRQWEILKLLPNHGTGLSTRELTERINGLGFGVTKRTVERDIAELSVMFAIDNEDSKPGAPFLYRWMRNASFDIPGVSIPEAVALAMTEDYLQPLLPAAMLKNLSGRFQQARTKLSELPDENPSRHWNNKVRNIPAGLTFVAPDIATDVLDTVHEALMAEQQIQVIYQSANRGNPKELRLHPVAVVHRGVVAYLIASTFDYPDPRLFALHRIQRAEMIDAKATLDPNFNLDRFLEEGHLSFGSTEQIVLKLAVKGFLARALAETRLSTDQSVTWRDDDSAIVTATLPDTWQLHWWLLSKSSDVEVLEPPTLRAKIATDLRAAAAQYD